MSYKNCYNKTGYKKNKYPLPPNPNRHVHMSWNGFISQPVPEVGKTYIAFDDGKKRPSRAYKVTVKALYRYMYVKKNLHDLFEHWIDEKKSCYWLFADTTDYFVHTINQEGHDEYFVRTKGRGWFSIGPRGLDAGQLDVDRHIWKNIIESMKNGMYDYSEKEIEEIIKEFTIED